MPLYPVGSLAGFSIFFWSFFLLSYALKNPTLVLSGDRDWLVTCWLT